ncbi:MAG: hypothetical protein JNK38_09120 [Acidobacteria bacterium]|nr:hypothetical protein [Acidobacteriota bacterium]
MDRISYVKGLLNQRARGKKNTAAQQIEALKSLPRRPSYGVPPQWDDGQDHEVQLITLRPEHRRLLGVTEEFKEPVGQLPVLRVPDPNRPPTGKSGLRLATNAFGSDLLEGLASIAAQVSDATAVAPQPKLRIRVQAIVCRNDDGKFSNGGLGQSQKELASALTKTFAHVNKIYEGTGIELVFYPSADLEIRNDTRLNQDFIVPESDRAKLTKNPPLTVEEINKLIEEKWTMHEHRTAIAKQYPGKMVLLFAEGTTVFLGVPPTQDGWRWCNKCQGMFFSGAGAGKCPAGSGHDANGSGNYMLTFMHDETAQQTQDNWRYCKKCQGLYFAGNNAGVCPAGAAHDGTDSGNYVLGVSSTSIPNSQNNWRWCKKCQGLFFADNNAGKCPVSNTHDASGSGNYRLLLAHEQALRWVISSPSGGGFSSHDMEFAKLSEWVPDSDAGAASYATLVAHETGHFLHLWHTFYQIGLTDQENGDTKLTNAGKADILRKRIAAVLEGEQKKGVPANKLVDILDADAQVISDTPPDDGGEYLYYTNLVNNTGDSCGTIGTVKLTLTDGTSVSYTPDRSLVMSYFKGCVNFKQHFSPKQAERMRNALINGNRRRLVGVQLGDTSYPGEYVCAAWNPNSQPQFYTWNNTFEEFKKQEKQKRAEGMRLRSQQAYTVNGQTKYDGIWNPGTHEQTVIWGWAVNDFKARDAELKGKGLRLRHFESYLLPDGQVRINAIWNPGMQLQEWVQGWAPADFITKANGMHQKGFRLVHLNSWNMADGQLRFDAIWEPGTQAQWVQFDLTADAFQKKYGEMWAQDFKLLLLDAYRVGNEIRFNGVWNPDAGPQYVVWNKTREQVRADYDEMWQQGMKLTSMSAVRL